MRCARPSTIAVLPTPASPISTGLFLVRRDSTWMVRRISSSRPITGSSLPSAGGRGQVAGVLLQRVVAVLGGRRGGGAALAHLLDRPVQRLGGDAGVGQHPRRRRAGGERQRQQQPLGGDEASRRPSRRSARPARTAAPSPATDRPGRRRCPRPSAAWRVRPRSACIALAGSPPAARIRLAASPSLSSSSTERTCSGVSCWLPRRSASVCADWMKPFERSVYFSKSIDLPRDALARGEIHYPRVNMSGRDAGASRRADKTGGVQAVLRRRSRAR